MSQIHLLWVPFVFLSLLWLLFALCLRAVHEDGYCVLMSLLPFRDADEVFQRLWAAVDSQLFPSKARGSRDSDTGAKRPQDQSLQSAFIGFRAALLVLHIIKQRLLLRETQRDARLTHDQLQRMASIVFTEGRGFLRVFIVHLECKWAEL